MKKALLLMALVALDGCKVRSIEVRQEDDGGGIGPGGGGGAGGESSANCRIGVFGHELAGSAILRSTRRKLVAP